ncbi:MAG: two-component system, NtrC family, response regulator PilR [Blastocatellia bacterium]|nr:two-component system, NtrC family, response regulator PilR [Blastocatellia bacterium]
MVDVTNTKIGLRKKSVLIVDDNAGVQKMLTQIVTEAGLTPITASNRQDALELADRQAFDVAVVDMRLVENDASNRDGLAILRHIARKNEGTHLVLLTGYGEYEDAVGLSEDIGTFTPMIKKPRLANLDEKMRTVLAKAIVPKKLVSRKGSSARLFCGTDDPGRWEIGARDFLNPVVGLLGLMNLLDEIAKTCTPLLERPADNGIQGTSVETTMGGLFWSRGVGEGIVVVLARDHIPGEIPRLEAWPPSLTFGEVKYQVKRKNLVGAIVKVKGVAHTDFTVARSDVA